MREYDFIVAKILYDWKATKVEGRVILEQNVFTLTDVNCLARVIKETRAIVGIKEDGYTVSIDNITVHDSLLHKAFALALMKARLTYSDYMNFMGENNKEIIIDRELGIIMANLLQYNLKNNTIFSHLDEKQKTLIGCQDKLNEIVKFYKDNMDE